MQFIYKHVNILSFVLFLLVVFIFLPQQELVARKSRNIDENNATRITSRKMVYTHQNNQISFEDNVRVKTGDFRMQCDDLVVYLQNMQDSQSGLESTAGERSRQEEEANQQSMDIDKNLDKVVAKNNVHIKMDNRSAQSDKAVYLRKEDILILTGNVLLKEGQNRIRSGKVRLYLEENKSEIVSGKGGRVEALIFPSSNSSQISR